MIRHLLRTRLGARGRDDGIALIMVIGVTLVLTLLSVSAIAYAVGSQRRARGDQDWNGAMAAAYAGIEEYQSHIANDPSYFRFGNPAQTFVTSTTLTLPTGASANPAFGLGPGGTWAPVAGSDGLASFRYEVDNSAFYTNGGALRLRATGRAGGETRSIVAELRQKGFIDFLYFTDYEIQDPDISGATGNCEMYRYEGRSTADPPGGCGTISFTTGDEIAGPMHTNDGFQVSGSPNFLGLVTTAYPPRLDPSGRLYYGTGTPVFNIAVNPDGKPIFAGSIKMPATNSELKKETRPDLPNDVPRPGCLYTGPTSIEFKSNGKMVVRSPFTRFTSPVSGVNNAGCGTPGSAAGRLGSATGQELNTPENNVIFVQNVPQVSPDANYWGSLEAGRPVCLAEDHANSNGRNAAGNPVGYPAAKEYVADADVYGCTNGDVFVKGTLNGSVTVASENYTYIVGDIVYADRDDDILGLVGQNSVFIYRPQKQSSTTDNRTNLTTAQKDALALIGYVCTPSGSRWKCNGVKFTAVNADLVTNTNRTVQAAVLSVAHTFQVQNFRMSGNRGKLFVRGAIAQKFRGPVGLTDGTGYTKGYVYDPRFAWLAPPKFLSPTSTVYGVNVWVEISPVFKATGEYR